MSDWLSTGPVAATVTLLGAPISRASISPSQAWATPPAFREALARFPTWDAKLGGDVTVISGRDAGDVIGDQDDADASEAHRRIEEASCRLVTAGAVLVLIGGDNSLTRPAFVGASAGRPGSWGLLTLDAHHDCRPVTHGSANGTPVRELIEGGLRGEHVAQVGIHPLGNAREHAQWAADRGIHVHTVDEVHREGIDTVVRRAIDELHHAGVDSIYVDLDVDVVDRAAAPACPASLPGGISGGELISAARVVGREASVRVVDLCEVDARADVAGMTVRLMAAAFTALCAGIATRAAEA